MDLKKAYGDKLDLRYIDASGHSASEPGIRDGLVKVCLAF